MTVGGSNAPAWLFSFVDLAFLLLIAMTQLGGDERLGAPDLGELVVPRLEGAAAHELPADAGERWQLRVHPREPADDAPFELTAAGAGTEGEHLAEAALRARLAELRRDGGEKPLLAPHEDSRSRDLLVAVDLLEELWPGRRRATVVPLAGLR